MQDTLAKYISDYDEDAVFESQNTSYKPFFFSIPNYRKTNEALEAIINLPHSVFVEITSYNKHKKSFGYLWDESPDIALSLSTISCYTSNLSNIFADLLNKRFALGDAKNMEIATCLQEAIMNSMFHGNLKMQSDFRTLKGMYAYQEEIKKRLMVDHYKFSTISIRAWYISGSIKISISDEGDGFNMPTYKEDDKLPNGRGLMIIQSLADKVWIGADRKTLFVVFNS